MIAWRRFIVGAGTGSLIRVDPLHPCHPWLFQPLEQVAFELIDGRHALLLHGVAVAHSDRLVIERLEIDGDAEGVPISSCRR